MTPLDPRLLAAILDDPDDDFARLVAAEWWDEHGEPARAEFVRTQCTLAGFREPHVCGVVYGATVCWVCALRRRERELLDLYASIWGPPRLPGGFCHGARDFRGGFIESITLAADDLPHLDAILAGQPVRRVTLDRLTPELATRTREGAEALLRAEWPQVREWCFPPGEGVEDPPGGYQRLPIRYEVPRGRDPRTMTVGSVNP